AIALPHSKMLDDFIVIKIRQGLCRDHIHFCCRNMKIKVLRPKMGLRGNTQEMRVSEGSPVHDPHYSIRLPTVVQDRSSKLSRTRWAPFRAERGLVVVTARHFMLPRRAASTPATESSMTRQRCGAMPMRREASRNTAGSGLPGISAPDTRAAKHDRMSSSSTMASTLACGAEEATVCGKPAV